VKINISRLNRKSSVNSPHFVALLRLAQTAVNHT